MPNHQQHYQKNVHSSASEFHSEVYREHTFFKLLFLFTFHFLLFTAVKGQHSDCATMLVLKDSVYHAKNIAGYGEKLEFDGNQLKKFHAFEKEKNSIWYLITMPDSGIFTFDIVPENPKDDWDFLLYQNKKMFCKRIAANKIQPIRSNLSRSAQTGLSVKAKQTFVGAGINNNYSKALSVQKGAEYVLVVNNPKKSGQNHTLILHYPKIKSIPIPQKKDSTIASKMSTIQFQLAIQSAQTKKPVAADVSINGFEKKPLFLTDITNYETNLPQQSYRANINIAARGYMLTSVDMKVSKNKKTYRKEVLLEEIKVGEKVNLKRIQFYGASPRFLPTAKSALTMLLSFMQLNENVKIEIEGHVNGPGQRNSREYQELSDNRAKAVKNYLIENGIDASRLEFVGYGNTQMLFPQAKSPNEMSANRRVEIKIIAK